MCGIFAYHGISPPDPAILVAAALSAGRRGPHGHGWVTRDQDGLHGWHYPGPVTDSAATIGDITAPLVLGHARLATFGDWQDVTQLQPIIDHGHAVAHNGSVYNAASLAPGKATDTIALAAAYAGLRQVGVPPVTALDSLVDRLDQHAWVIVVADADGGLYAHRSYHPLYQWRDSNGGAYLSSWAPDRSAAEIPEDQATMIGARR